MQKEYNTINAPAPRGLESEQLAECAAKISDNKIKHIEAKQNDGERGIVKHFQRWCYGQDSCIWLTVISAWSSMNILEKVIKHSICGIKLTDKNVEMIYG